jgi:outer membrane protein
MKTEPVLLMTRSPIILRVSRLLWLLLAASLSNMAAVAQTMSEPQTSLSPPAPAVQDTESSSNQGSPESADSLSLTMHEAVKLALKQNPRLLEARLQALESKQTANVARAALLPKAALGFEEQADRLNLATAFGQEAPPYSVGPYSNVQLGATFDVPLIAVSAWRSYQAEKQRQKSSQLLAADERELIASLVVGQYLSLLRSKAIEQADQSRIDLAAALLHLAQDELTQGTGTSTDALRADVQLQVEKQNLVRAQAQTRAYAYGLAQLLGLKENQYVVATEMLSADDDQVPDEQQSLTEAFNTRPDLLSAKALSQAANLDRKAVTSQRIPEFHFDGFWAQSGRNPGGSLPIYTYQGEMRFPLFTGGRIAAESRRAALAAMCAQDAVTDRQNVITQEVRTSLSSLEAARQELQLSTRALQLSTRELTESRNRFAAGVTNNIEVITAQTSLAQANDSQIGAMYDLQQAKADLALARGRIAEDYGK